MYDQNIIFEHKNTLKSREGSHLKVARRIGHDCQSWRTPDKERLNMLAWQMQKKEKRLVSRVLLFVGPCWHSGRLTLRLSLVRPLRWGSRSCWPSWSLRSGGLGPEKSSIFILNKFWSFNLKNGTWFPPSSICGALATASGDAYKTPVQRLSTVCKVLNLA